MKKGREGEKGEGESWEYEVGEGRKTHPFTPPNM